MVGICRKVGEEILLQVIDIDSALSKANSMLYAFRYLNSKLSRSQFKTLINAHFLSKLTYASQVWYGT